MKFFLIIHAFCLGTVVAADESNGRQLLEHTAETFISLLDPAIGTSLKETTFELVLNASNDVLASSDFLIGLLKKFVNLIHVAIGSCAGDTGATFQNQLVLCEQLLESKIEPFLKNWPVVKQNATIDAIGSLFNMIGDIYEISSNAAGLVEHIEAVVPAFKDALGDIKAILKDMLQFNSGFDRRALVQASSPVLSLQSLGAMTDFIQDLLTKLCSPFVEWLLETAGKVVAFLGDNQLIQTDLGDVLGDIVQLIDKYKYPARNGTADKELVKDVIRNLENLEEAGIQIVSSLWALKNETCLIVPDTVEMFQNGKSLIKDVDIILHNDDPDSSSGILTTSFSLFFLLQLSMK